MGRYTISVSIRDRDIAANHTKQISIEAPLTLVQVIALALPERALKEMHLRTGAPALQHGRWHKLVPVKVPRKLRARLLPKIPQLTVAEIEAQEALLASYHPTKKQVRK